MLCGTGKEQHIKNRNYTECVALYSLVCKHGKNITQPFCYTVKKASDGCSLGADSFAVGAKLSL